MPVLYIPNVGKVCLHMFQQHCHQVSATARKEKSNDYTVNKIFFSTLYFNLAALGLSFLG